MFSFVLSCLRDVVTIVVASRDEGIYTDYYFGIDDFGLDKPAGIQNILNISGAFKKRTQVHAIFYHVRNGVADRISGFSVGRSQDGEPWFLTKDLTLAIADTTGKSGTFTQLGCYGHISGRGTIGYTEYNIDREFTGSSNGRMRLGNHLIIYVSDDTEF